MDGTLQGIIGRDVPVVHHRAAVAQCHCAAVLDGDDGSVDLVGVSIEIILK